MSATVEHTFSLYTAARQFVADADLDDMTADELAEEFAASLADEDLRPAICSVSRTIIVQAVKNRARSNMNSGTSTAKGTQWDEPDKPTLEQRIKDTYIYMPDGTFKPLAEITARDCDMLAVARDEVIAAIRARADAWRALGAELRKRGRKAVTGLRADLVVEILGPGLGSDGK